MRAVLFETDEGAALYVDEALRYRGNAIPHTIWLELLGEAGVEVGREVFRLPDGAEPDFAEDEIEARTALLTLALARRDGR
jgi:hypothetical protein